MNRTFNNPRQTTATWLSFGWKITVVLLLLAGCSNRSGDANDGDAPGVEDPPVTLEASFACLSAEANPQNDVRWDVALTLGEMSNHAYENDQRTLMAIRQLGATDVAFITEGSSEAIVASDEHSVVIAFRGTQGFADIITDIKIFARRIPEGRVHRGFHDAIEDIYESAKGEAISQGAPKKAVWITGHSLGGAMAMCFAHRTMVDKSFRPEGIVTFGQPLAVDTAICQFMLDEFKGDYVRFVNDWDIVTRLLPNYRHAGARVHLTADGYTLRLPTIAYSAHEGTLLDEDLPVDFVENEEGLRPLTEAEFRQFETRFADEQADNNEDGRDVRAFGSPFSTPHTMGSYLARLRNIGGNNFKTMPTGSTQLR